MAAGIVAVGAVAAIALGSGLTAWATWAVGTTHGSATLRGDALPAVGRPDAVLNSGGVPKISWVGVRFPSGAAVGGYAVVRHVGAAQDEVCRVAAATLTCTDTAAAPGSTVAYSVRAVAGDRWAGDPSPKSDPLTVAGGAGPAGLAVEEPVTESTESSAEEGKKDGSDGDGDGADGAVEAATSPSPGPASSAPSAAVEPAASSASPSPSVTDGGEGGGGG
jgi:hypothetical protein